MDRALVIGVLALVAAVVAIVIRGAIDRNESGEEVPPTAAVVASSPAAGPSPGASPVATPGATPRGAEVVCLDLGHGGQDWGNVRIENDQVVLKEKDLTLQHGLELADRLRADGIAVVTTRDTDQEANPTDADVNGDGTVAGPDVTAKSDELDDQQARVNICNEVGADLLVSMHYNASDNTALEGYEIWFNDERPFSNESERFATLIHGELGSAMRAAGLDATDRGIGIEDHAVTGPARPGKLVPSEMPGAVVEALFLSNDVDAAFVQTAAGREAIIGAYERAIVRFFRDTPT